MQLNVISCRVRWFKISAQRGKEMVDLLFAICIQTPSSQPILLVAECLKMCRVPRCMEKCRECPHPSVHLLLWSPANQAKPSFEATIIFPSLWSQCSFVCFENACSCVFIKASSSFLAKAESIKPPSRKPDKGEAQGTNCPQRTRQSKAHFRWVS